VLAADLAQRQLVVVVVGWWVTQALAQLCRCSAVAAAVQLHGT
jgi:hypothetical protein